MGIIKNVVNYLPIATNISGNVTKSECVNSLFKGFNIIGVILIVRMFSKVFCLKVFLEFGAV